MKKRLIFGSILAAILLIGLTSCQKDPPTCDFTFTTEGLTVTFTAVVANTDSYAWDFGDEETSTEANPVHVYTGGGDFNVKLVVTGEGGTAEKEKEVTVTPNAEDYKVMLTGGPNAASGKTWVLKTTVTDGDGASAVEPNMLVLIPTPADFFGWIKREWDNEYNFKYNGSYSIIPKNDSILACFVFAALNNLPNTPGNPYGVVKTKYTVPTSATWTLNETTLTVDAITNPTDANVPPAHGNVTFSNKKWLSFSTGAFLGILDWKTQVIIKSISPTEMRVAILLCLYQGVLQPGGIAYAQNPTHMYHMTFVPKP